MVPFKQGMKRKTAKVATVMVVLVLIIPGVLFFFNNCSPQGQGILGLPGGLEACGENGSKDSHARTEDGGFARHREHLSTHLGGLAADRESS